MPWGFHWLPCWCSAVVLESFAAKRGSVPGGALVGGTSNGRVGVSSASVVFTWEGLGQPSSFSCDYVIENDVEFLVWISEPDFELVKVSSIIDPKLPEKCVLKAHFVHCLPKLI